MDLNRYDKIQRLNRHDEDDFEQWHIDHPKGDNFPLHTLLFLCIISMVIGYNIKYHRAAPNACMVCHGESR